MRAKPKLVSILRCVVWLISVFDCSLWMAILPPRSEPDCGQSAAPVFMLLNPFIFRVPSLLLSTKGTNLRFARVIFISMLRFLKTV